MNHGYLSNYENTHISPKVQRPEISLNPRLAEVETDREWTAARCKRLLRALTSRVAILRKEVYKYSNIRQSDPEFKDTLFGLKLATKFKKKEPLEWKKRNQRVKQTYGGIRKTKQSLNTIRKKTSSLPGEVLVPTPVLMRVRGDQNLEQGSSVKINLFKNHDQIFEGNRCTNHNTSQGFKNFLQPGQGERCNNSTDTRYDIFDKIYHGFESLLHSTLDTKSIARKKGSRTLLDMSLRAIPKYIVEQQELLQMHFKESGSKSTIEYRDICGEIYDELENFGTCGYGWKRLRDIVRAHGLQVISDTIKEGLFDLEFCYTLISLCIQNSAFEEAQTILTSFLSCTTFSQPKSVDDKICEPFNLLQKFSKHKNQTSFFYRTLSDLISERILPFEWLASTNLGIIWTGLIQSLTLDSLEYEAFEFCEIAFPLFLKYPDASLKQKDGTSQKNGHLGTLIGFDDAVKNTFSSLLTILVSISILDNKFEEKIYIKAARPSTFRYEFINSFLRRCLGYVPVHFEINEQYLLLLVANLITINKKNQIDSGKTILESLSNALKKIKNSVTKFSKVAMFLCQVAQCCGKGTSGLGYEYLQLIHLRLKEFQSESITLNFLKGIIVDSSFIFARKVPRHQHVEYAASMNATHLIQSHNVKAPMMNLSEDLNGSNVCGFRWEEGIGEWVTVTPAVNKLKRKFAERADCDSSSCVPPNLRHSVMSQSIIYENAQSNCGITPIKDLAIKCPIFTQSRRSKNYTVYCESPLKQKSKENKNLDKQSNLYNINEILSEEFVFSPDKHDKSSRQCSITDCGIVTCNIELSDNREPAILSCSPNPFFRFTHHSLSFTNQLSPRIDENKITLNTRIKDRIHANLGSNISSGRNITVSSQCNDSQLWKIASTCENDDGDEDELSFLSTAVNNLTSDSKSVIFKNSDIIKNSNSQHSNNVNKKKIRVFGCDSVGKHTRIENARVSRIFPRRTRSSNLLCEQTGSEDELCS
ncbi:hypothetical protein EV44_g2295 [Erysiphe necator]|uniref:Uncharacterized protein n=1 Tax=Uncinula necator TaxID=52586 RepID=A0A0B1NZT4_UNCNE|nr:hypothetical protein EV44_g2295 [Erysiphe necator]